MRNWMKLVATALVSLSFASQAVWALPYEGTLQISVGALPSFDVPSSGDGVSTPAVLEIGPGATFTTVTNLPITNRTTGGEVTLPAFPIVDLALTGPAGLTAASFAAGAGPDGRFGGDAGLTGNVKLGLFGPPPFAFLTVPLSPFGVEGATARVFSPGGVNITVIGGGWTTGTALVIGTTGPVNGQVLARATGTDTRTPGGRGTIVLVTPTLAKTNVAGATNLPVIGTLTLNFVPEPSTLLLLGSGTAGLVLHGRRRSRA